MDVDFLRRTDINLGTNYQPFIKRFKSMCPIKSMLAISAWDIEGMKNAVGIGEQKGFKLSVSSNALSFFPAFHKHEWLTSSEGGLWKNARLLLEPGEFSGFQSTIVLRIHSDAASSKPPLTVSYAEWRRNFLAYKLCEQWKGVFRPMKCLQSKRAGSPRCSCGSKNASLRLPYANRRLNMQIAF